MARIGKWIGLSAADAGIRLAAQLASTAILARILIPEDFGTALMALTVVTMLGTFVSTPFEEALTQRGRLATGHLRSALLVSLLASAAIIAVLAVAGPLIARASGVPSLAVWMPVAALFLIAQGPGSIARAICRRQGRFDSIAVCQAASAVIGCIAAIVAALAGMGVFALILQRMLPIALYPMLSMIGFRLRGSQAVLFPGWDGTRFREIFRFSGLRLTDEIIRAMMPTTLTFIVNAWFGTAILGQLSIAMRLVEPLRSAIVSVGHNLVFSILAPLQNDPQRLGATAARTVANVASVGVPVFLGIAICAPLLLPLVVGPGWEGAADLSRAMCVAAAISVPFRYLYTGFGALGRPEYNIIGSTLGLIVTIAGIWTAARMGTVLGVSFALILTELSMAGLAIFLMQPIAKRGLWAPLLLVLRIWVAATLMVFALEAFWLRSGLFSGAPILLVPIVVTGMVLYAPLLWALCNPCFQVLQSTFLRRGSS